MEIVSLEIHFIQKVFRNFFSFFFWFVSFGGGKKLQLYYLWAKGRKQQYSKMLWNQQRWREERTKKQPNGKKIAITKYPTQHIVIYICFDDFFLGVVVVVFGSFHSIELRWEKKKTTERVQYRMNGAGGKNYSAKVSKVTICVLFLFAPFFPLADVYCTFEHVFLNSF